MTDHLYQRLCAAGLLLATAAWAQLPVAQLTSHYPGGGRQGATMEVHVTGSNLDTPARLHFSHPGITSVPLKGSPENPFLKGPRVLPGRFNVTIAPSVPVGIYELRVASQFGVSGPRAFQVSDLPEVQEIETNHTPATAQAVPLNSIINGHASAGAGDYFKFPVQKGQRVLINCWARRLDSLMDPIVVVYNTGGQELARTPALRDRLVDFTAPTGGTYLVRLFNDDYRGNGNEIRDAENTLQGYSKHPSIFRLSISTQPHIDFIFPPMGQPGGTGPFTLYGRNLPGGKPAPGLSLHGHPLEQLPLTLKLPAENPGKLSAQWDRRFAPSEFVMSGLHHRVKGPAGWSNTGFIGLATAPMVMEKEPNSTAAKAQPLTPPCEVAGQFYPRDDADWFRFTAKKGEQFWIEVISHRLEGRTDPHVLIQYDGVKFANAQDKEGTPAVFNITTGNANQQNTKTGVPFVGGKSFNTAPLDVLYKFTAPNDGDYRVLVHDLYNTGDSRNVYRLAIRNARPDFRLIALPMSPSAKVDSEDKSMANKPHSILLSKGGSEAIEVLSFRRDGLQSDIILSVEGLPPGVTWHPVALGPARKSTTIVLTATTNARGWVGDIRIIGRAKVNGREIIRQACPAAIGTPTSRLVRNLSVAVSDIDNLPVHIKAGTPNIVEQPRGGKIQIPIQVTRRNGFNSAIVLKPFNAPKGIPLKDLTIPAGQTSAKMEFTLPGNSPVGTYSFHLRAQNLPIPYERNPAALKSAEADAKEIETALAATKKELEQANMAKTASDKAVAASQNSNTKHTAATAIKKAHDDLITTKQKPAQTTATAAATALTKAQTDKTAADKALTVANAEVAKAKTASDTAEAAAKVAEALSKKIAGDATKKKEEKNKAARDATTKRTAATTAKKTHDGLIITKQKPAQTTATAAATALTKAQSDKTAADNALTTATAEIAKAKAASDTAKADAQAAETVAAKAKADATKAVAALSPVTKVITTKRTTATAPKELNAVDNDNPTLSAAEATLKAAQKIQKDAADQVTAKSARMKEAEEALKLAVKNVETVKKSVAKKNVSLFLPSTTASFKITPSPVVFVPIKAPGKLRMKEKLELPVTIKRLYNYNGPVQLTLSHLGPPPSYVSAPAITIPAGQTQGKLVLEARFVPAAKLGTFPIKLNLNSKLNGQTVNFSESVDLTTIESAPPVTP